MILVRFGASFVETSHAAGRQRTMAELRVAVFAHVQKLAIRYFDRTPIGRIVTRVTDDIDSMGELFASGAVTAIGDLLLLIGIVTSMLMLDPKLSLMAFTIVPPLAFAVEIFRRSLRGAQRAIRARIAELNAFLNEQVQGIQVVQAFSREARCAEAYAEINGAYREANRVAIRTDALLYSTVEALATICIGFVLWYAASRSTCSPTPRRPSSKKAYSSRFYAYIISSS